jgi:DNA-binding response OmpR family regulator
MKILLVEDDLRIQEVIKDGLKNEGHSLIAVTSAEDAIIEVKAQDFDVLILDLMLPSMDGLAFCRWLRDRGHKESILILTAKGSVEEKLEGFEAGADDYLTKPFVVAELRARIMALVRKTQGYPKDIVSYLDIVLDPNTGKVSRGGTEVSLSDKECRLLLYLISNRDKVVTRAMISNAVWENDTNLYTNVIDVFVNHIRKKIDSGTGPKLIHTVRGKGFLFSNLPPAEDGKI